MNSPNLQHIIPSKKYLLAVSGGMDSMVMLNIFLESPLNFMVAHVNYQLRGEDSELDERLVSAWCHKHSIPFHLLKIDMKKEAEIKTQSIQLCAREVRYAFFRKIVTQEKLDIIATAHHADDNIETLLFHFFRGSGIEGLCGMPAITDHVIRPLLHWTKKDIKEYARKNSIEFREDISNSSTDYTRNKIRLEMIPQLEKIFPALKENLLGNITRLQHARIVYKEGITQYRKKLVEKRGQDDYISILKLKNAQPLETITYELLKPYGFEYEQSLQVLKLLKSESGHWVESHTHQVIRNRNVLIITEKKEEKSDFILIEENARKIVTADFTLHIKTEKEYDQAVSKKADTCTVPLAKLEFPLILRKWKQGDYLYPFGMNKKKKISRVLIDAKIPLHEKGQIWVLESGKKIVWVVGLRTDNRFRIDQSCERVIFSLEKKTFS